MSLKQPEKLNSSQKHKLVTRILDATDQSLGLTHEPYTLTNSDPVLRELSRRFAERNLIRYKELGPIGPVGSIDSLHFAQLLWQDVANNYDVKWENTSGPLYDGILAVHQYDFLVLMNSLDPNSFQVEALRHAINRIQAYRSLPEQNRWTHEEGYKLNFSKELSLAGIALGNSTYGDPIKTYMERVCVPMAMWMPNPRLVVYECGDPERLITDLQHSIQNGTYDANQGQEVQRDTFKPNHNCDVVDDIATVKTLDAQGNYLAAMANGLIRPMEDYRPVADFADTALTLAVKPGRRLGQVRFRAAKLAYDLAIELARRNGTGNSPIRFIEEIEEKLQGLQLLRILNSGLSDQETSRYMAKNLQTLFAAGHRF